MKKTQLYLIFGCCLYAAQPSWSQQGSSDVLTILRASFAAQAGQNLIQDVTLTGNAESIAGSDDETVPFAFKGTLSGSARSDINLSAGTLTEIRTVASSGPTGFWSRGNGEQHPLAGHNLMTDPEWCAPVLVVERLLSNSATSISYIGTEGNLAHFIAYQPAPAGAPATSTALIEHLGQIDLYLDPKTFLPAKLSFSSHPDNNALLDQMVSIEFSNYQTVNSVTVPMHIQRYINSTLALDIQIEIVSVNNGLSAASF